MERIINKSECAISLMLVGIVVCVTVLTDSTLVFGSGVTGQEMPSLLNSGRLHIGNINQNIVNTEFAVEGLVHRRALELKVELKQGIKKPFEDLIEADTGDIADQKLITFVRQVTAAACLPELLDDTTFPDDVKSRVQNLLQHFQGNSIGTRVLRLRRSSKKSSYSEERKEFLHF
ncbi:hypothetical protein J6590_037191 [Homalodisca vitripennis]|nr:hypothetical protein J6590_037191 [Homalodisca vitripennis]